ncbi:MAG: hypothetical protein KDD73_11455 [Anaerolineales bacterium]|nr:hypothetical protein [Anaerolineales bacterium]MCB9127568.1 hypothetical protein [Ardenticatenales bacterium]
MPNSLRRPLFASLLLIILTLAFWQVTPLFIAPPLGAAPALTAPDADSLSVAPLKRQRHEAAAQSATMAPPPQTTVEGLWAALKQSAQKWRRAALWIPLALLGPGWLLAWLLRPSGRRPVTPLVAGISMALVPFSYLLLAFTPLRLYEPLIHSFLQASVLLLILLMLQDLSRLRAAFNPKWRGALFLLAFALVISIGTWLLIGTRPSVVSTDEALRAFASTLAHEAQLSRVEAPLPPAALAANFSQITRQSVEETMQLMTLMLGVALLPALFGLAAEVGQKPTSALWVMPLAWVAAIGWHLSEGAQLTLLYTMVVLPVAVALGLRALRATERSWLTLFLAAIPLATLGFLQGVGALLAWLFSLLYALLWPESEDERGARPSSALILWRSALWLVMGMLLYLPSWWFWDDPFARFDLMLPAYALTIVTAALALFVGLLTERARSFAWLIAALALPLCLLLAAWWVLPPDTLPALGLLDQLWR